MSTKEPKENPDLTSNTDNKDPFGNPFPQTAEPEDPPKSGEG